MSHVVDFFQVKSHIWSSEGDSREIKRVNKTEKNAWCESPLINRRWRSSICFKLPPKWIIDDHLRQKTMNLLQADEWVRVFGWKVGCEVGRAKKNESIVCDVFAFLQKEHKNYVECVLRWSEKNKSERTCHAAATTTRKQRKWKKNSREEFSRFLFSNFTESPIYKFCNGDGTEWTRVSEKENFFPNRMRNKGKQHRKKRT